MKPMNLTYTEVVKRPALLHRLTGLTVKEFETLLESFSPQYDQLVIQPRVKAKTRKRAAGGGQKGGLPEVADKLLFILVYTRIYPLLIIQGMFFGIAESKACKWVGILLPVLDAALGQSHMRPKRAKGRSLEEIIEEFPELKELGILTDGTERPIRRPKDDVKQKENYSGKKKRHTSKHITITHPKTQRILAVSEALCMTRRLLMKRSSPAQRPFLCVQTVVSKASPLAMQRLLSHSNANAKRKVNPRTN